MYHITQGLCFTEVSSLILNQSLFIVGCSGGTNYLLKFNKNPPKNVFSTTEFKNVIFRTTSVFCLSIYWWVLNLYAAIQLKLLNQFEKSASSYCQFMDRFMFKVFFLSRLKLLNLLQIFNFLICLKHSISIDSFGPFHH